MKKQVIILIAPVAILILLISFGYSLTPADSATATHDATIVQVSHRTEPALDDNWVNMNETSKSAGSYSSHKNMIGYALSLIGTPYKYTGITRDGFDCSGFVTHVFDTYNMDIPHSSALQANEGIAVNKNEAAPGDLVIFTGTNENVREPGHVGIVISEPGDTISFVHSSSNGGVKISKVQGTRYDVRFLEVRRVL